MRINEFDELIYEAFEQYKFSLTVLSMAQESITYYKRKGFHVYKDGDLYKISWLKPQLLKRNDNYNITMHDYFTAEHLYMALTNNNDIQSLTPSVVKQKLLKGDIISALFSVHDKTIVSLYRIIIDELLLASKAVYLTSGVLSLKPVNAHSINLIYPVTSMALDDNYDLSADFVNTTVMYPLEDIDYTNVYNKAKGEVEDDIDFVGIYNTAKGTIK